MLINMYQNLSCGLDKCTTICESQDGKITFLGISSEQVAFNQPLSITMVEFTEKERGLIAKTEIHF